MWHESQHQRLRLLGLRYAPSQPTTDVAVENFLKEALTRKYPEYGFWGEESGQSANQTNRWIVDPIDGTHSFSRGQYFWAISAR